MKKTVLQSTLILSLAWMSSSAQDLVAQQTAERAPLVAAGAIAPVPNNTATQRIAAMWDVLFNYDLTSVGPGGYAGICFVGNEYWCSKWASDTVAIFDAAGTFLRKVSIPGTFNATSGGIRSMTYDGTYIYAGVNTASIKKINANSTAPTVAGTITAPSSIGGVRSLAYDPTANSGAGGFWVSNFATDILQISMTGATLNTIALATHGLGAMYGTVYDGYSAGGPYLWVCDQGASGTVADMVQLNISTGMQTGVIHDILTDVGLSSTGGLGGGIYLHAPNPGLLTLVGCLQGTPNLIYGYDMNTFVGLTGPTEPGKFLSVYPSVSNSFINIKLDKQNNNDASIHIFDATGRVVFDKNSKGENNYINVANFAKGVYVVRVEFENNSYTTRFVKD